MVKRIAARLCGLHEHAQIFARRLLPDKLVERFRAQGGIDVFGSAQRGEEGVIGHFVE